MQHLRCCFLYQKLENRQRLLTVVTKGFILKVTGLLYPNLQQKNRFRVWWYCFFLVFGFHWLYSFQHSNVQSQQQKHLKNMSNMLKNNNKDTSMTALRSTDFVLCSTIIIAEFKQINASFARETIVSDNKFAFSYCEKYIALWTGTTCWTWIFILIHPTLVSKRIIQWQIFSWQNFKRVSQTLSTLSLEILPLSFLSRTITTRRKYDNTLFLLSFNQKLWILL